VSSAARITLAVVVGCVLFVLIPVVFWGVSRTQSGTFKDGDLLVNKDGLRIVSQSEEGEVKANHLFGYSVWQS
jgi:hypothetical protein